MLICQRLSKFAIASVFCLSLLFQAGLGLALDTDIYQANVKQNAYVLLDNSGSMAWPVYESSIDYAAMFAALSVRTGVTEQVSGYSSFVFPAEPFPRNKVYLVQANNIGVSIISINGESRVFPGDAGNPDRDWFVDSVVDLHVYLDSNGILTAEVGQTARLTTDADGNARLDGVALPLGQDRKLHDYNTLFDGSIIDEGLGGLLKAPGYYFSALEGVNPASHNKVEHGDADAYFFVTGNWLNMQHVCNLVKSGVPAWKTESFPISEGDWMVTEQVIDFPAGNADYGSNLGRTETRKFINHPGASQIQIHFSLFDVDNQQVETWVKKNGKWVKVTEPADSVKLYGAGGNLVGQYNNDNNPQGAWSVTIPGDTVEIALTSNSNSKVGKGYTIDKYRVTYSSGSYTMQSRLAVAQDALLYVVDEMAGKINWGFATFAYTGSGSGDGATIRAALNPNDNDDANRQAIKQQVENVEPKYGTPLGEALQDVFEDGYYGHRNSLDNLLCRKNYAIVVSDGFPSSDDDWKRIAGKTFTDEDGDGFTADPSQYSTPPANYYDDVAHWMYTHSWRDKTAVADPASSYENVISHQIAFGAVHPLMQDAAEEAGGEYITAYNKTQLVNAFHSLALMISEAISFTAPVVSVDAANKVQNGDDLYMGQFLPMDATYWPGNLKKFVLGDGSEERPYIWQIYDAKNNEATDRTGLFLDNTAAFWGDDNDANDADNYGAPDIKEDGAGEVLTEKVVANFKPGSYYARNIKTYVNGSLVEFDRTLDPAIFGLDSTDKITRDKIVNWVYGFTFDSDETIDGTTGDPKGVPIAARDWALGAIIHSRPTVIDYYNETDLAKVDVRYVVAGADDGMLHVFNDVDGSEVLAFVPADVLPKLKAYETVLHQPLVDGTIKLHREDGKPKYLIFGLRRGGASYWALDVSDPDAANWTVAWVFSDTEMVQSWSDVAIAKIRTAFNTYTNVAIFSGGYDPREDNFPEPFLDMDNNGTPYKASGILDASEWSKTNSTQDVNGNGVYDKYNPAGDLYGRAIYVVNIDTGKEVFSVRPGAADSPALGSPSAATTHFRSDFRYCFPASPSVVSLGQVYSYPSGGATVSGRMSNVLAAIYAPDIYGNLFRITYDYAEGGKEWQVQHLFSANPGSNNVKDQLRTASNGADAGRKVFYGPTVSWRGSGRFFDSKNYYYPNTTFFGTGAIASVFFGTGDREHPSYQLVKNRVYAVYDDLPITTGSGTPVSTAPYDEGDLLNVTCDDLGVDTVLAGATPQQTWTYKTRLTTLLTDDVATINYSAPMEDASTENDAKGWYIILERQGVSPDCDYCEYVDGVESTIGGRDYHYGESVLGKLTLFDGVLYFTTYQPAYDNPCEPQGNAFSYGLNYLNGAAALNHNKDNEDASGNDPSDKSITDRYVKHTGVKGLPSGFEILVRDGRAGAVASIGGRIVGGGDGEEEEEEEKKKCPDGTEYCPDLNWKSEGIKLYYWVER